MKPLIPVYLTEDEIAFLQYWLQNWGQYQARDRVVKCGDIQISLERALRDHETAKDNP